MLEVLLAGLVITNISNSTLPWNTTLPHNGSALYIPHLITQNIPWFFPFISLVFLMLTDYLFGIKNGVDSKLNFFGVALAYTILVYVEVAGNLTTSGYFYVFEFIMLICLFVMTLFSGNQQG